jgi:hypothetical protein
VPLFHFVLPAAAQARLSLLAACTGLCTLVAPKFQTIAHSLLPQVHDILCCLLSSPTPHSLQCICEPGFGRPGSPYRSRGYGRRGPNSNRHRDDAHDDDSSEYGADRDDYGRRNLREYDEDDSSEYRNDRDDRRRRNRQDDNDEGSHESYGICTRCPKGTYSYGDAFEECRVCPGPKTTPRDGATSESEVSAADATSTSSPACLSRPLTATRSLARVQLVF